MSKSSEAVKEMNSSENSEENRKKVSIEEKTNESVNAGTISRAVDESVTGQEVPMASSVIKAPIVCPPGYRLDAKGKCRKIM
jgi:hypothetical protein